jgi:peptidyl-prolyl cis-trans isomerase D
MAMEALRIAAKESKFMKFILGGFIFLAVGGLVFTDVQGYFRGGLPNNTVARVNDTEIQIRTFDQEVRNIINQSGLTAEEAFRAGLINAYLNNRIDEILLLQQAESLDIVVGEKIIAEQIKNAFPNLSKEQIQMSLRAQGMSEGQMAQILSQQIKRTLISGATQVLKNTKTPDLSTALNRYHGEFRNGTIYSFPASKLSETIEITDEEVASIYEARKNQYIIPEKRVFTIGRMTLVDVEKNLPALSEDDVRGAYEEREGDFFIPEKRSIAQAVISDPDQAQQIYEQALDGTPLKTAVENVTGNAGAFRDAAEYDSQGLPAELADVAFADDLEKGSVLPPVRTLVGLHVMKIVDITPERQQEFEEVKDDLRAELEETRGYDALYEKIIESEDLVNDGQNFDAIAEKVGLSNEDSPFLTRSDVNNFPEALTAAIEISPSITDEIFNLPEGSASYPVEINEGEFIVIGVKTLQEESFKPLEDVKNDLREQIQKERLEDNARTVLSSVIADVNAGDRSLDDVVKEYGAGRAIFRNVTRSSERRDADAIFDAPLDGIGTLIDDGTVSLIQITANGFNTPDAQSTGHATYTASIDSLFRSYLRENSKISINDYLLEQQYNPENP